MFVSGQSIYAGIGFLVPDDGRGGAVGDQDFQLDGDAL